MYFWTSFILLTIPLIGLNCEHHGDFTNGFVVEVDGGREAIETFVKKHGFLIEDEIPELNVYHLTHPEVSGRSKRSSDTHLHILKSHSKVKYGAQQQDLLREKRHRHIVYDKQRDFDYTEVANASMYQRFIPVEDERLQVKDSLGVVQMDMDFADPFYKDEWYLKNRGQTGGIKGMDLNVQLAWRMGYTGKGVVACILDDGIDHTHPDLIDNFDTEASADFNDMSDMDPMPRVEDPFNSHGTKCAGEIAAKANNDVCGVGIAYDSKIGGIRMLDGTVTDFLEAKALSFKQDYVDVFSASWGPKDDGKTLEGPYPLAVKAFVNGVLKGRNGLGSIYVWATGNGGLTDDDCNADGYVSRPETLSIGSVNDRGARPFFMEACPSTLAVVPTGGYETPQQMNMEEKPKIKVVTTDLHKGCTLGFQGTSSAAPMATGCIILALQANNQLTWRDVQHIVVRSARITINDGSWVLNGAGFHVSPFFGFGVLDCSQMVAYAQTWKTVPERHLCEGEKQTIDRDFGSHENITVTYNSTGCHGDIEHRINSLEHVQIHITLQHSYRGDTQIFLRSPQGTVSEMLSPRPADNSSDEMDFTFTSVQMWGEDPSGTWTLTVIDNPANDERFNEGRLLEWTLILHGFYDDKKPESRSVKQRRAYAPDKEKVELIMEEEKQKSLTVTIKKSDTWVEDPEKTDGSLHHNSVPKDGLSPGEIRLLEDFLKSYRKKNKLHKSTSTQNLKRTLESVLLKKSLFDKKSKLSINKDGSKLGKKSQLSGNTDLEHSDEILEIIKSIRKSIQVFLKDTEKKVEQHKEKSQQKNVEYPDLKRLLQNQSKNVPSGQVEGNSGKSHEERLGKALFKIRQLLRDLQK